MSDSRPPHGDAPDSPGRAGVQRTSARRPLALVGLAYLVIVAVHVWSDDDRALVAAVKKAGGGRPVVAAQDSALGPAARYLPAGRTLTPRFIELATVVDAPADAVYPLWSTVEGARRFFGVDARIDLRVGGIYEIDFEGPDPDVLLGPRGTAVVGYTPGRDIAFEWTMPIFLDELNVAPPATWVEIHLEAASDPRQTRVRLGHYGFGDGDRWAAGYRFFEVNWFEVMHRFRTLVDDGLEAEQLLVANLSLNSVARFDATTGVYLGDLVPAGAAGLTAPTGIAIGPDGDVYVASSGSEQILRFEGDTGELRGVFAEGAPLTRPFSITFGPQGDLYVSAGSDVLRYDATGRFRGHAARHDALAQPIGIRFGPGGLLWVASSATDTVMAFDPASGAAVRTIASQTLRFPSDVAFDRSGTLWVSSAFSGSVERFDPASGEPAGEPVRLPEGSAPVGLVVDDDDRLVIADFAGGRLYRWSHDVGTVELLSEEGLGGPENLALRRRTLGTRAPLSPAR